MLRSYGGYGYNIERFVLNGVSEANITSPNVQLAFQFRLPCRLRFPKVTRFTIPDVNSSYVAFLNEVPLPSPSIMQDVQKQFPDETKLNTTAISVSPSPQITKEFVEALAQGTVNDCDFVDALVVPALNTINRVVVAHCKVADLDFGASRRPVVSGDALEMKFWVCAPNDHTLSDPELETLAKRQKRITGRIGAFAPYIDVGDLGPRTMAKVSRVFSRLEHYVFDEFEYASEHFGDRGEDIVALLMAVVALEASHGAFLRECLERKGLDGSQSNNYLKDQGFYATLPVTMQVFMRKANRPTESELKSCLDGVEKRNAVMHATTSKGKAKMRRFTKTEIDNARRSVLEVHERLVSELEFLLANPGKLPGEQSKIIEQRQSSLPRPTRRPVSAPELMKYLRWRT